MSKKVKIFVIVIAVIAVLIVIFNYVGGNATPAPDTSLTSSVVPGGATGNPSAATAGQFADTLSTINTINLDTSLFSNPAYQALRDFPVDLGTAIIGRNNPFAPMGTDTGSSAAPSLQIQTLAPGKVVKDSAELGALVTVNNTSPVTVVFQYGTSTAFGSSTAPVKVTKSGTALFTAKGLTPGTTYYVEAVAVQGSFTATGTSMTFTTLP